MDTDERGIQMQKFCKNCGRILLGDQPEAPELCPECRIRAHSGMGRSNSDEAPDWRKPLYDYALSLRGKGGLKNQREIRDICIRLGDYPPAKEYLREIEAKIDESYRRALKDASGESTMSIRSAIRVLEDLKGLWDTAHDIERAERKIKAIEEREASEREEAQRQEKRRKQIKRRVLLACAGLAVAVFLAFEALIAPYFMQLGDAKQAEGDYPGAIACYEKACFLVHRVDSMDRRRAASEAWADQMVADGDYAGAIAKYEEAGNDEKYADTHRLWAEKLSADGDYADAIEKYEAIGDDEGRTAVLKIWTGELVADGDYEGALQLCDTYNDRQNYDAVLWQWSDALAQGGNATLAIEKMQMVTQSDERDARIWELQYQQAGELTEAVFAHDAGGTKDAAYAREQGSMLTDLDAQLRFCHELHQAGYDLMEVYPDGVWIENVPLARYQPDSDGEIMDPVEIDNYLLFERIETVDLDMYQQNFDIHYNQFGEKYPSVLSRYWNTDDNRILYKWDLDAEDDTDDSRYAVKLLPGHMFEYAPDLVARNWEEADKLILLDGVYYDIGELEFVKTTWTTYDYTSTKRYNEQEWVANIPCYEAVNSLAIYDKDNPMRCVLLTCDMYEPICASQEWREEKNKQDNIWVYAEDFLGEFDFEPLYSVLPQMMYLLKLGLL